MEKRHFETLTFGENGDAIQITLLKLFKTEIPRKELVGYTLEDAHTLAFPTKKAALHFDTLLLQNFERLTNKLTGNKVTYIHRQSGIPLMGNVAFGIVYRGSSIIEIKPITSCNLDCVYCSISEGLSSTKNDFVVEKEYILQELATLLDLVGQSVEIHIGVQGEPFLYDDMPLLISDLQKLDQVHTISIDTNGTLLTKQKIDLLAGNDKLQVNLSLDAMDEAAAKKIAGVQNYNLKHVLEMIRYAAQKLNVIVAPVLTQGYNEQEMEKIIEFVKTLNPQPRLGIQNFLRYKTGRDAAHEIPWKEFYALLEDLGNKHQIKLRWHKEDFNIQSLPELSLPFKEGDCITAVIKSRDRFPQSVIVVAKGRNISVPNCDYQKDKKIKIKIVRDKHNIFTGKRV